MEQRPLIEQISRVEQLMLRVGWQEQRWFAQDLRRFGLTAPQFFVLRFVAACGQRCTMSTLADATLLRCATMTGIVGRLVRMGLVTRQRGEDDRRKVLVDLTASGREVLLQVQSSRRMRLSGVLHRLSPRDASELLRLLGVYLEAFSAQHRTEEPGALEPWGLAQF